eukprot:CAMPEP_0184865724 /NCGR_PEP_ID=MMETSP0580-20130426/18819_1 /TAXON_ID=1118495 /ORGANISM="Dactyliosolen fragilissimus" /LENGTH=640 /DNA_ID=CAMNT_0027365023 /DNA_START=48 /DNA_END=1967 /DNA_ORIENTATION=-
MNLCSRVLTVAALPYILGIVFSSKFLSSLSNIDDEFVFEGSVASAVLDDADELLQGDSTSNNEKNNIAAAYMERHPYEGVSLFIHRNGEAEACGTSSPSIMGISEALKLAVIDSHINPLDVSKSKYIVDIILTKASSYLLNSSECGPEGVPDSIPKRKRRSWGRNRHKQEVKTSTRSIFQFCDMGVHHTPILPDHDTISPVTDTDGTYILPCHFHTREGVRINSLTQLAQISQEAKEKSRAHIDEKCSSEENGVPAPTCASITPELHLYAVPAGRVFMFAPSYVGEVFELPHVSVSSGMPVSLKVISLSPKVFDLINFFDKNESSDIVQKAIAETSDTHKMKRSSTGATGYNVNNHRTSENGFDTHGATAMKIKKRCMKALGFDEYIESFTDGLQVLRYNKTTAYIPHMDWIDDPGNRQEHNYDSAGVGTNRFATVLLYMSDLGEGDGGETVFKKAWPIDVPVNQRKGTDIALREIRESGELEFLREGSWEEKMVADCKTRLAIRPSSAHAVLFYSQHPNGEEDESSLHGGCPVLSGEKWAANLWVWNGPRPGYDGAPVNEHVVDKNIKKKIKINDQVHSGAVSAIFLNTGNNPDFSNVSLYYEDKLWADFSTGQHLSVNTYVGHRWKVKNENGKTLKIW